MSHQPVSGDTGTVLTGVGTTVLSDLPAIVRKVVIGGTYVGTVELYDSATAAGTAAGNNIYTVGLPALNLYRSIEIDVQTRRGITAVATGTPSLLVTWDK